MYRKPHQNKALSPGFNNQNRESPKASAASLFDSGFSQQYNNQYNQNDFNSFINQPAAAPVTNGPMFGRPPKSGAPPPAGIRNQSGPPSASDSTVNPYRRPLKNAHSLFPGCCNSGFTPVTFATTSSQAKLSPSVSQSIETSAPSVLPVIQTTGENQQTQAEEDNDRLREEKISQRNENSRRFQTKRDHMIAEQEVVWKQKKEERAVKEAFSVDTKPFEFAERPKTKAERKEIRERARKARLKRHERRENQAGDLGTLIDEISSMGTSVCSDDINKLNSFIESPHDGTHLPSPGVIETSGSQQQPLTNQGQSYPSPTVYSSEAENPSPYLEPGWEESVMKSAAEAGNKISSNDMQSGYAYGSTVYQNYSGSNIQSLSGVDNASNGCSNRTQLNQVTDPSNHFVMQSHAGISDDQNGAATSTNASSEIYQTNSQTYVQRSLENNQVPGYSQMSVQQSLGNNKMAGQPPLENTQMPGYHSSGNNQMQGFHSLENMQHTHHSLENNLMPGYHSLESSSNHGGNVSNSNEVPGSISMQTLKTTLLPQSNETHHQQYPDNTMSTFQPASSNSFETHQQTSIMSSFYPSEALENQVQQSDMNIKQIGVQHNSVEYQQQQFSGGASQSNMVQQTNTSMESNQQGIDQCDRSYSQSHPQHSNSQPAQQDCEKTAAAFFAATQAGQVANCQPEIRSENNQILSSFEEKTEHSNLQQGFAKSLFAEQDQIRSGSLNQFAHSQQGLASTLFNGQQPAQFDGTVTQMSDNAQASAMSFTENQPTQTYSDSKHGHPFTNQDSATDSQPLQYTAIQGHPIDDYVNTNHPMESQVEDGNVDSQKHEDDLVHVPYQNDSHEPQYISDLGNQNYFAPSEENLDALKKKQPSRASSDESQGTITSTEGSSYGFIPSVKSSDSESRLSPYQFIDGVRYPCQSSENSNNSSPLEIIENISAASTSYENVMPPNLSLSSFDITEPVDNAMATKDDQSVKSNTEMQEPKDIGGQVTASGDVNPPLRNSGPMESTTALLFDRQKELEKTAAELFQKAKQAPVKKDDTPLFPTQAVAADQGQRQPAYNPGVISSPQGNLPPSLANPLAVNSNQFQFVQSESNISKAQSSNSIEDMNNDTGKIPLVSHPAGNNPQSIQLSQPAGVSQYGQSSQFSGNSPSSQPPLPAEINRTITQQVGEQSQSAGINLQSGLPSQNPGINPLSGQQSQPSGINPVSGQLSQHPGVYSQSGQQSHTAGVNMQSGQPSQHPGINLQTGQPSQHLGINPQLGQLSQHPGVNLQSGQLPQHPRINPCFGELSQQSGINLQSGQLPQPAGVNPQSGQLTQPMGNNLQSPQSAGINPQFGQLSQPIVNNMPSKHLFQPAGNNMQSAQLSESAEANPQSMIQSQIQRNTQQSMQIPPNEINPQSNQVSAPAVSEVRNQIKANQQGLQYSQPQQSAPVSSPQSSLGSQSAIVSPLHSIGTPEQVNKPIESEQLEKLPGKNALVSEVKQPQNEGLQYFRKRTPQSTPLDSQSPKSLEQLSSQSLSPQMSTGSQQQTAFSPVNNQVPPSNASQPLSPGMQQQFLQPLSSFQQTAFQTGNPTQVQAGQLVDHMQQQSQNIQPINPIQQQIQQPVQQQQIQQQATLAVQQPAHQSLQQQIQQPIQQQQVQPQIQPVQQQQIQQPVQQQQVQQHILQQQTQPPVQLQQMQQPLQLGNQLLQPANTEQQSQSALQDPQSAQLPSTASQVTPNPQVQMEQPHSTQSQIPGNQVPASSQPFPHQAPPEGLQLPVQSQYQQMQQYPPGQQPSAYGPQGPYMVQNQYGQQGGQNPYDPAYSSVEQQQMDQMMWDYQQQSYWAANYYNQYNPYMSPAFDYGYPFYNWPYPSADQYSYTSSAPSSDYGGSRAESVIERPSSRSSGQICSELAELSSELSFQNRTEVTHEDAMQRSTPLSFTRPHVVARFWRCLGMIGVVAPKQPLDGEIASIQNVKLEEIVDISLYTRFPGPLLRGDTNKKQIAGFINETIRDYLPQMFQEDDGELFAHIALWEFIGMLVKQNGTFDGADVSDLLISLLQAKASDGAENKLFTGLSNPPNCSTENMLEEFHHYMATGRTKDGLDHAISSKLWGHAFMLGSVMGEKWIGYVQTKYQQNLSKSDPIRTLYAHLHNKDPEYFQKKANVETWVQNLCMLVSQRSGYPQRDKERLIGFGDSLRDQGLIAAAHLCYLIAEVPFGTHTCGDDRLVLIGLEHKNSLHCRPAVWAKTLNMQLTEIYVYARTLHSKQYTIPQYQKYKYEYGLKLLEFGYPMQGLSYLESIGLTIICDKTFQLYDFPFCHNIIRHAKDILLLEADNYNDLEFPSWLNSLEDYTKKRVSSRPSSTLENFVVDRSVGESSIDDRKDVVDHYGGALPIDDQIIQNRDVSATQFSEYKQQNISTGENFIQNRDEHQLMPDRGDEHSFGACNEQYNEYSLNQEPNSNNQFTEEPYNNYISQSDVKTSKFKNDQYGDYNYHHQKIDNVNIKKENSDQRIDEYGIVDEYDTHHNSNYSLQQQADSEFSSDHDIKFQHVYTDPIVTNDHYNSNDQIIKNEPVDDGFQQYEYGQVPQHDQLDQYAYVPSQIPQNLNEDYTRRQSFEHQQEQSNVNQDSVNDSHQVQSTNIYQEPENEEEDLFSGFSNPSKDTSAKGKEGGSNKKYDDKKKDLGNGSKSSKGWLGGIGTYISKLTNRKEAYLPDDNEKTLVYDEKLGKWIDRNGEDEDVKSKPPPPPKAMTPFVRDTNEEGENQELSEAPILSPPLARKASPIPVLPSQEVTPTVMETKSERIARNRKQRRTLLQQSKEAGKSKEEDVKPKVVQPASPFSMRASKKRGPNRYVNVMGDAVKSAPMMPVLDPMSNPAPVKSQDSDSNTEENMETIEQSNNMPMFFDPSKLQAQPSTSSVRGKQRH